MKKCILKRLEVVEHAVNAGGTIPDNEKVVAISCPAGDNEQFQRLRNEALEGLREKYGVLPDDLLVVWLRSFGKTVNQGTQDRG